MSNRTIRVYNDQHIVYEWGTHYLRDDRATGICDYERYSLFRWEPYGREIILSGGFEWALHEAKKAVKEQRTMRLTYEMAHAILDIQEHSFHHDIDFGRDSRKVAWFDLLEQAVKVTGRQPYQWQQLRTTVEQLRRIAELEIELSAIDDALERALTKQEHADLTTRRAEVLGTMKTLGSLKLKKRDS